MSLGHSPQIVTNGMVLCLDAANPKNFNLTEVEVLVVAGGGGGAADVGGGGGAGGLVYNRNFAVTPGSALTVTVGGGGAGRAPFDTSSGGNGGNSVFGSITATGGGGGGGYNGNPGNTGGSGGGGGGVSGTGGAGTSGQGFSGGSGNGQSYQSGGGGGAGEAGEAGKTGSGIVGGNGGNGLEFPQFASVGGYPSGWFAGGGGGGGGNDSGSDGRGYGGLGGGGTGAARSGTYATNSSFRDAVANTGGGGGGTGGWNTAGAGGSGIVIVRYQGPQKAIGGTVTTSAGHTIHTFTTVGSTTFTPLVATNNSAILGLSDFSGNGNFGTTANSPTYSSANGGSVSFDGTNDYVNCGSPSTLNFGTGNFNLSCWINIPSTSGADWIGIISRYVSGVGFWIQLNPGNRYVGFGWDGSNFITSSTSAGGGQWKFISCQRTASTSAEVYVNGILVAFSSSMPSGTSTGQQIDIGRIDIAGRYSAGNIAQVSIYNRALTSQEISQNFNALRSRYGI